MSKAPEPGMVAFALLRFADGTQVSVEFAKLRTIEQALAGLRVASANTRAGPAR